MPRAKERELQGKVYREYRKKGYGKKRSAYIARAVTYGPHTRRPKKRSRFLL